jgi:hypothetical protein
MEPSFKFLAELEHQLPLGAPQAGSSRLEPATGALPAGVP